MSRDIEPELSDLIEEAVLRVMLESRTAIPGHVVVYHRYQNGTPEHVEVQLGISRQTRDGQNIVLPQIDRVPILWPGAAGFHAGAVPEVGDELLCVVCDRAIDAWIDGGGVVKPRDGRLHSTSDIVAMPGLRSAKKNITVDRGRKTYYLGTDSGDPPWLRLKFGPPASAVLEAPRIDLGKDASLGVARQGDTTTAAAAWLTWFGVVGTFIGTPPPAVGPFATIATASVKVFAE